jgi:PAS domain S-box-containing protein
VGKRDNPIIKLSDEQLPVLIQENGIFLQSIFDAIPDGFAVLDKNLNILQVNSTTRKWCQGSGPVEGQKCYQVYSRRKKPCSNCPAIQTLESGSPHVELMPWVVSQKTLGWHEAYAFPVVDSAGKLAGIVKYVRDVSSHVKIKQALLESEQKFRTVADFTYDWEYWITPDGNILYVSPSCKRITGYTADQFIKDAALLEKIVHPDDRSQFCRHLKKDLKSKDVASFDFRIRTRTGEKRWIGHICQPVYGSNGQLLGRRTSNRDITDRIKLEKKLKKFHEELDHRVQERTRQLQVASDELNSKHRELLKHKSELEKLTKELLETNKAISVLAKNMDKSRQDSESSIARAINSNIMPIIEDLQGTKSLDNLQYHLDTLAANMRSLANGLAGGQDLINALTQTEVRVATLIKNGLSPIAATSAKN